jgi:hypothetical protein
MPVKKFVTNTLSTVATVDPDCRCGPHGIESPTGSLASPLEKLDHPRCECKKKGQDQPQDDDDPF